MIWSFAGFLTAFYVIGGTFAAFAIPNPYGALALLVCVPLFLYGPALEALVTSDDVAYEKLCRLFDCGQLTIRNAYLGGLLCGVISHALGLGIGALLYWQLGMSLWLLVGCVPPWLGAFLAISWVVAEAEQFDQESKGVKI
jgi:hypothetical protein